MNLLPGLRELRAPLTTGYLWLAAGWVLLLHGGAEPDLHGSKLGRAVQAAAHAGGRPATLAALTFIAYLVGSVSVSITTVVLRRLINPLFGLSFTTANVLFRAAENSVGHSSSDLTGWNNDDEGGMVVHSANHGTAVIPFSTVEPIRRAIRDAPDPLNLDGTNPPWLSALRAAVSTSSGPPEDEVFFHPDDLDEGVVFEPTNDLTVDIARILLAIEVQKRLLVDLAYAPSRLIGKESDLYNLIDRLGAEAEFRTSVSLPLTALSFVASIEFSWTFLLVLPLAAVVGALGISKNRQAQNVTAQAIYAGRTQSPVLNAVSTTTTPVPTT